MIITATYPIPTGAWQTFAVQSVSKLFYILNVKKEHKIMISASDLPGFIKELRKFKGWTGTELAAKIGPGYSKQVVSSMERGSRKIGSEMAGRLAEIFGISLYVEY